MNKRFRTRGVDVDVSVVSVREPRKETAPKLKNSSFLVTMNTNYRPKNNEEAKYLCASLTRGVEGAFKSPSMLIPYVKFLNGDQWSERTIKKVNVLIGVEIGNHQKGSRVHAHVKVEIDHYSKIHLNPVIIKEQVNLHLAKDNAGIMVHYVNISVRNSNNSIDSYVSKPFKLY